MKTSIELNGTRIVDEQERQAGWKSENERRRHNYVPAIFAILEQLAKKNMLSDLFKEAQERKKAKDAEKSSKPGDVQMQQQN